MDVGILPATRFTLSVWLNATSLDATPRAIVWWDDAADTTPQFLVFSTSTVTTLVALGGFSPSGNWTVTPPSTGTWHHLAITYDPSSTANNPVVYLDGVSQPVTTTRTPVGTWVPSETPMILGNGYMSVPWDMAWHGSLAGVALWDTILSSADLATLASHGDPCGLSVSRWAPHDPTFNTNERQHLRLYLPLSAGYGLGASFEGPYSFSGWTAAVTGTTLTAWTGIPTTTRWGCMDR
ncbi:MAG: LamG domain-containing protein [Candidatus Dormibacteria bacterium]